MDRLITREMMRWRDAAHRRPLVVRGARQVGKTYSVLEFGRAAFAGHVHHVDLELRRDAHAAFGDDLRPDVVLRNLQVILGVEVVPGRDLLFIDEIQACPRAIASSCHLLRAVAAAPCRGGRLAPRVGLRHGLVSCRIVSSPCICVR